MRSPLPTYLKSWFLFFLIASLGGGIAGGVLGVISGGMMGAFGAPTDRIVGVVKILAFIAAVPISFFTFRWSVSRYIVGPMLARAGLPPVD